MKISVRESSAVFLNLRTRMPFRYGIATMTRVPHFILKLAVEIDGQIHEGVAADNLAPKWFAKDPTTSFAEELRDMLEVIGHARMAAVQLGECASPFELWSRLYAVQKSWAATRFPPLLWNFGVTLVERAVIDAFCRARKITFAEALRKNHLGVQLGQIFPELSGFEPSSFLPEQPRRPIIVRHTVGLTDPLTIADILPEDRANDGLPEALESYLEFDGVTHLKIKLSGNVERDLARLRQLADLLAPVDSNCAFTLDGNENFHTVAPFIQLWDALRADPKIAAFLQGLIFVEQPFHRDVALRAETFSALHAWGKRPPIIIDESDAEVGTLAIALEGGYAGTSHKNCKGVFKGIANASLIAHRRRLNPDSQYFMSAEDLTNVGPIALLQDLAVVASLGIPHAERNGHHYFAGLAQFPKSVQSEILKHHGDLYDQHLGGFPVVRVEHGRLAVGSVIGAPFGFACEIDFSAFTPEMAWSPECP